jgi:hypothetical protein
MLLLVALGDSGRAECGVRLGDLQGSRSLWLPRAPPGRAAILSGQA